jgi:hypothetical protein
MSKERISRIKPFDPYDYWTIGDIEHCPYPMWNAEYKDRWVEWNKQDKQRMMLIALERYANYLTTGRHDYRPPRGIEES